MPLNKLVSSFWIDNNDIICIYLFMLQKTNLNYHIYFLGCGKCHLMLLFVAGGSLLSLVTELINMGFVLPSAKCEIEITGKQEGILLSIGFLGIVVSSHFWGFLTDTWGRKNSLQLALISGLFFSVLSAFSTSSTILIIMRFLTGFWYVLFDD